MSQEFYISVTPVRVNEPDGSTNRTERFLIRVERVAPGVPLAEELVDWPIDDWLEKASQLMHHPLLGILQGQNQSLLPHNPQPLVSEQSPAAINLIDFGQTLYNALFQGTIRDSWMTAQGIAQNRKEGLRLRLGLKGDRLPRLPWEVLHAGDRPLATGTDVIFSRYQASFAPMATVVQPDRGLTLEQNQPLRILMVLAAPTDQKALELQLEATNLEEELRLDSLNPGSRDPNSPTGDIELTILKQPGREQLTQALEQGRYQVLHYSGHSSQKGLYLVNHHGLTEILSGDDLAGLLVNNRTRIAVFNSCRGAYTSTEESDNLLESGNLTEALLKRGIPAVLAMAERIPDAVALTLSRLFYRNLKQRYPIDLSLSRTRQGLLSSYGANQPYWALPILYLHPNFDGYPQTMGSAESEPGTVLWADGFSGGSPSLDNNLLALPGAEPVYEIPSLNFQAELTPGQNLTGELGSPLLNSALFQPYPGLGQGGIFGEIPAFNASESDGTDRPASSSLIPQTEHYPIVSTTTRSGQTRSLEVRPETNEEDLETAEECIVLGQVRQTHGDIAGAITAYGRALQLNPDSAIAYSRMGIALERCSVGGSPEAIIAYKMALQLNPNLVEAQRNLERLEIAHNFRPSQSPMGSLPAYHLTHNEPPQTAFLPAQPPDHLPIEIPPDYKVGVQIKRPFPWKEAGALVGALSVIMTCSWWIWRSWQQPSMVAKTSKGSIANTYVSTKGVSNAANDKEQSGDLEGQAVREGIETLLNQNDLQAAAVALNGLSPEKQETPLIHYLRGRLAWQSIQAGDRNYNIDDARRAWREAVKRGNKDPRFYNALGFAYYAEGNLKKANDAWSQSGNLAGRMLSSAKDKISPLTLQQAQENQLTADAGQALSAARTARGQSDPKKRRSLQQEAIRLRDRVLKQDRNQRNFREEKLAKNWLWNDTALAEWKVLLRMK